METKNSSQTSAASEKPKRSELREFIEMIITTLIMALFGITFVIRSVNVPTGSMNNTIYSGDFLLVNKFIFGYEGGVPLDGFTPTARSGGATSSCSSFRKAKTRTTSNGSSACRVRPSRFGAARVHQRAGTP
ncbi:S26 family signal peptidase [Chloracidobacterium sp. S]|nr:S26 family signal peptidase [Chloracidobacterium sp. S]